MKKTIRLTENDLMRIVKRVINENDYEKQLKKLMDRARRVWIDEMDYSPDAFDEMDEYDVVNVLNVHGRYGLASQIEHVLEKIALEQGYHDDLE